MRSVQGEAPSKTRLAFKAACTVPQSISAALEVNRTGTRPDGGGTFSFAQARRCKIC